MQFESSPQLWWGLPWTDVLTALGTTGLAVLAFIAILFAVWGRRRERKRAAAAAIRDHSRQAAAALNRTIFDQWRLLTLAAPGSQLDSTDFLMAISIGQPALDDRVLAQRVNRLAEAFGELGDYVTLAPAAVVHGDSSYRAGSYSDEVQQEVGRWYRVRVEYTQALARQMTWVGQSLAAHQVGRPLPAEDAIGALPSLSAAPMAPTPPTAPAQPSAPPTPPPSAPSDPPSPSAPPAPPAEPED
jgi:hypothetical protein